MLLHTTLKVGLFQKIQLFTMFLLERVKFEESDIPSMNSDQLKDLIFQHFSLNTTGFYISAI